MNLIQENKELRDALIKCRDTLDEIRMDKFQFPLWCEDQIEAVENGQQSIGGQIRTLLYFGFLIAVGAVVAVTVVLPSAVMLGTLAHVLDVLP